MPWVVPCESVEWSRDLSEVFNEAAVEIGEPPELLNVLLVPGYRPLIDPFQLRRIHRYLIATEHIADVVNFGNIPFTLLRLQEQIVVLKAAQNLACDLLMLLFVGGEDEYVIQEDLVHHGLESCGGIREAEEHHQGFVQSPVSYEGRLPFIAGFDPDVVVSPSDIELREERGTAELIHHLGDQRQGVVIFDGDRVQPAVVLYRSKCPFLLFDEEKGGHDGRLRFPYVPFSQLLL
ncbi:hypothetical protein IEO21_09762 [Rhodonia placenta]|uniref:Uncharacterized protein n=1 Tax=Rhodonia placenta TaxID=104341 RepID=A0A8H7NTQ8_9APHY|nr:hypothetical protein IEO21_09762 [Postia placenta]